MPNRAKQFVDWLEKWLSMAWENKPKWLSVFYYVYARDTEARDENNPDWPIQISRSIFASKFDEYTIKQDIDQFFNS